MKQNQGNNGENARWSRLAYSTVREYVLEVMMIETFIEGARNIELATTLEAF